MQNIQLALMIGGMVYGAILILGMFVRTRFTELLRLDNAFMPRPSESTRFINLIFGLLIFGYNSYEFFKWLKALAY